MCIAKMIDKNPAMRDHLAAKMAERKAGKEAPAPIHSTDPRAVSSGAGPRAGLQVR